MRHLGVDGAMPCDSTFKAPADDTDESLSAIVGSVRREERTAGVALAGVLPALPHSGADHVRGHLVVHHAAVAISKDSDVNFLKLSYCSATR